MAEYLNYNLVLDFGRENSVVNLTDDELFSTFYNFSFLLLRNHKHKELLLEILAVEFEKVKLKDNLKGIKEIDALEIDLDIQREKLLTHPDQLLQAHFHVNPLITWYESDWKFVWDEISENFNLLENFHAPKGDYFFLFQRTGNLDTTNQSNVLEFSLSKFDVLLLQIFTQYTTVSEVTKNFRSLFHSNSEEEKQELEKNIDKMIKLLIFKKFVVLRKNEF